MEREACVCDHGYERSDLCAEKKKKTVICLPLFLKEKSERIYRPSEHPPVKGEKMPFFFRWDHRLQRQTSSWHLNGFRDGSIIGSTV